MLLKNLFKARDIVSPVPVGVQMTLEYDRNGKLLRIYHGFERNNFVSSEFNQVLRKIGSIPKTIHLKGNTSYVTGVLYTSRRYLATGDLPDCIEDQMIADFIEHPKYFKFIAATLKNQNQNLLSTAVMAQTLKMAGFMILPYLLITEPVNDNHINQIINDKSFPYNYPLIAGYYIYRTGECFYTTNSLYQVSVNDSDDAISMKFTSKGDIMSVIKLDDEHSIECSYTEFVHKNIHPNSLLVLNSDTHTIISSHLFDEYYAPERPSELSCPACGRLIKVPDRGSTCCSDKHCPSRMYPAISYGLKKLGLPVLTYQQYELMQKVDSSICSLEGMLNSSLYASTPVVTSLHRLLGSCITELSDDESYLIIEKCKNSKETLEYYMQNTNKVRTDLMLSAITTTKFINWCRDSKNLEMFTNLLHSGRVEISSAMKQFDGAPIFRNTKILITGTFKHGKLSDVADILRSYSADVTTYFQHDISVVVVGDIKENVDGSIVTKARQAGIQICNESEFFNLYKIDEDLKNYL